MRFKNRAGYVSICRNRKVAYRNYPFGSVRGIFDAYEMQGNPFFDESNGAVVTPVIRFKPFYINRQGDGVLRGIYFILKKNDSANTMVLIFSGTNERLSRITEMEFRQRIEGIAGSMPGSLAKVR